jgi:hypothetical protein
LIGGFVFEMNGMTKFMIAIGISSSYSQFYHYTHSNNINFKDVAEGTSMIVHPQDFTEHEV